MTTATLPEGLKRGDKNYARANLALLAAGLATFNALYSTQAILPRLAHEFQVSATTAALSVSAVTGMLAVCVVPASILSEKFGRGRVLTCSVIMATLCSLILPLAPTMTMLIALRGLQGMFLAGVPAVAMAWLSEEVHPHYLTAAMGIYISGNSIGGITGRLFPAIGLEFLNWQWALFISGLFAVALAITTAVLLPHQRRFVSHSIRPRTELQAMVRHWRTPALAALFMAAFIFMGTFISLYNFLSFRLIAVFHLSEGLVGSLFLVYLAGAWSSTHAGSWVTRYGRAHLFLGTAIIMSIGMVLCAFNSLILTLIGLLIFTAGFFLIHSVASSWVGAIATRNRAEGSSMYLFCYYVGSSILGWSSGYVFSHLSWGWFITWLSAWLAVVIIIGMLLKCYGHRWQQQPD